LGNGQVGRSNEEKLLADKILNSGNDRKLMRLFREESILITLMVQVRNQELKATLAEELEEELA